MPHISCSFGDLYVRIDGRAGDTIILLHDYFATGDSWAAQRSYLARQYQVVTPDLRGHGRSPMQIGTRITVSEIAEDILRIQEHLEIEQCHLAGCSLGGLVALHLTRARSELVRSAVVMSLPDLRSPRAQRYAERFAEHYFPAIEHRLDRLHGTGSPGYSRQQLLRNFLQDAEDHPRDHLDAIGRAGEISRPLLVIGGAKDPVFPSDAAVAFSDSLQHGDLAVLPRTGHLPHQEMPGIVNELILDHLLWSDRTHGVRPEL